MIQQELIMGFIDWIKELFSSQSQTSHPIDKERKRINDEEEEEIEELIALDIIWFEKWWRPAKFVSTSFRPLLLASGAPPLRPAHMAGLFSLVLGYVHVDGHAHLSQISLKCKTNICYTRGNSYDRENKSKKL